MNPLIRQLPKTELHIHIEGSLEPEMMFDMAVRNGVFMEGLREAITDARSDGITADLILCFLRHLSGEEAKGTIIAAEDYLEGVVAVGLDSSEKGRPPELFEEAYAIARQLGLRAVAHAGEEGSPEYITGALDVLGVERIDHGVRCLEAPDLVDRLVRDQVPLTVCPLSNVALNVVPDLSEHPLPEMIERGLLVSVNSDDPAYFGGYIADNYGALARELGFDTASLADLARGSIVSSFLDADRKKELTDELDVALSGDEG